MPVIRCPMKIGQRWFVETACERCKKRWIQRFDHWNKIEKEKRKHLCRNCVAKKYDENKVKQLNGTEKAYIAGMVDADGYITMGTKKQPQIGITNSCKRMLDWISEIIGHGKIEHKGYNEKTQKTTYVWRLCGMASIKCLLEQISPYLKIKKDKAKKVIQYASSQMQIGKI